MNGAPVALQSRDLGQDAVKIVFAKNIGDFVRKRILWLDGQWL